MSTAHSFLRGALALGLVACTGRAPFWTDPVPTSNVTYGLAGGVAMVDDATHSVLLLQGTSGQVLTHQSFTIGHNFQSAAVSSDGSTLFVLSAGDQPVQTKEDQLPELTVLRLDGALHPTSTTYEMSEPMSNLAVDPFCTYAGSNPNSNASCYVVAWSGSDAVFAQNPNEIVIFDLNKSYSRPDSVSPPPNPIARTIRSFGGIPQQLVYSPSLDLPATSASTTPRRLLFVETDIDVSIVDLTHAFDLSTSTSPATFGHPDITVQLTSGTGAASLTPTGLVVAPNADEGRVAFFTRGDTNVYTLQLLPAPSASPNDNDFEPQINLTDVGGSPSDIQFVHTDAGLRVAALVPSRSNAVLVEPDTSQTTPVDLSAPFTNMALVTDVLGGRSSPTDVALLWSTQTGVAAGVALWTLGTSVGQPYRSIEVLTVADPIQAVLDVPAPPGKQYGTLKVLATQASSGGDFYVLNLVQRTASPIHTTNSPILSLSPDGLRMWAYDEGSDLAQIRFDTLAPVSLTTQSPISAVYDIQNVDSGRSLVAVHGQGAFAATVFDAISPQTTARTNVALLLEAP